MEKQVIQTFLQFHKAVREKAMPEEYSTIEIRGDDYGRATFRAYIHGLGWFEGPTPESCIESIDAKLIDISILPDPAQVLPNSAQVTVEQNGVDSQTIDNQ